MSTIEGFKATQADNAYLLIIEERCEGLLWGMEIGCLFNENKFFQEMMWYVDPAHRRYGVRMMKYVFEDLKRRGFKSVVMGVVENYKPDKIKKLYESLGLKLFESQYIKKL